MSFQACIAVLYITITYILYYDSVLPLLIAAGLDTALLVALTVVAVVVGKPLSYLSCPSLPDGSSSTSDFISSVGANASKAAAMLSVDYFSWVGASRTTCYEMKAVWGLSVALCVLFAFSAVVAACLWRRLKTVGAPVKDIEG